MDITSLTVVELGKKIKAKEISVVEAVKASIAQIEKVEKDDLISHIMEILRGFSLKDQQVIQLYYFDELNLAEISELLGISQSRVCQIHKKMIIKLRERLGF